ncbi:LysM and putative peptidoglycan-binding domain-containing protein 1 [Paramecium bursaria]
MYIGESNSEVIDRKNNYHNLRHQYQAINESYLDNDIEFIENPNDQYQRLIIDMNKETAQEPQEYEDEWFEMNFMSKQTKDGQKKLVHIIQPDDTLEGLALQYGVPACKIRNYNHLNTNDIFYLKSIEIPDPMSDHQKQETIDKDKFLRELKIQEFVSKILKAEDKSSKVATFYLDMANWNMRQAIIEYLQDYEFEQKAQKNPIIQQKIAKNKVAF